MKSLQVMLLGPPEIRWNSAIFSIKRRQTRALLFYLAAQKHPVGRNHLLTVFWEDESDEKARQRLRETLNKLRSALPEPGLLITDSDLVGLDPSRIYVDYLEFQSLTSQIGHLPWLIPATEAIPYSIYQVMLKAVRLWRGGNFMSGANLPNTSVLDHWFSQAVRQTENQRLRILERLAQHSAIIGELDQAVFFLRQVLDSNPFDEYVHERLLRHLIDLGRLQEAGAHFRDTQTFFRQELNEELGPQLQSLYQHISRQAQTVNRHNTLNWHIHPTLQTPFVGRQAAMKQLNLRWQKGGGVFILGEPGIGKTRLLQEFVAQLNPRPRVLMGRCLPAEGGLPLQAILDSARHDLTSDDWNSFPAQWAAPILVFYPELASLRPDLPASENLPSEQFRVLLMEAFRQLSIHISRGQRLLAIVEDAQWADELTLALLAYIIERPPFDRQALLIVTTRGGYETPRLDNLLLAMQLSKRAEIMQLERLELKEISELARTVLATDLTPAFIERLNANTGGNPLHILESLRALLENGYMPGEPEPYKWALLPNLKAVIRSRLQSLSVTTRTILEAAAILGPEFDPLFLVDICTYSSHEVVQILDELKQRYLLQEFVTSQGNVAYRFIHNQIRETLVADINPLRAQVVHSQVARVLEARLGEEASNYAARLAEHYEAAGEVETAFERWIQAGRRARQFFSVADTHENFGRAENLLPRVVDRLPDERVIQLYIEWGDFAQSVGDYDTLERIHQDLRHWAEKRQNHPLIATALIGLSDFAALTKQLPLALEYIDQAWSQLEYAPVAALKVCALARRGAIFYRIDRYQEAAQTLDQAIKLGGEAQQPLAQSALGDAYAHRAMLENIFGWPLISRDYAVKSIEILAALKHYNGLLLAYSALALAQYLMGEFAQGRLSVQAGIALAVQVQNKQLLGLLYATGALIEGLSGHIGAGVTQARRAIALGDRHGLSEVTQIGQRALGDIFMLLRSYDQACACYQRGFHPDDDHIQGLDSMMRYGAACCLGGQSEQGLPYLTRAIERADHFGLAFGLFGKVFNTLAELRWSEARQTEILAQQLDEATRRRALQPWNLTNRLTRGLAEMKRGDVDAALTQIEAVIAEAAALSFPWIEIRALDYKIQLHSQRGLSSREAQQQLESLLAHLGASIEAEKTALGEDYELLQTLLQAYRLTLTP